MQVEAQPAASAHSAGKVPTPSRRAEQRAGQCGSIRGCAPWQLASGLPRPSQILAVDLLNLQRVDIDVVDGADIDRVHLGAVGTRTVAKRADATRRAEQVVHLLLVELIVA